MRSEIPALMSPGCDLDGSHRRREVVSAGFDRLRNRHPQFALVIEDALSAENGQPDDALATQCVAEHMTLGGLLALGLLRFSNMQVKHIAVGVVSAWSKVMWPILMFTCSMTSGPSGCRTRR